MRFPRLTFVTAAATLLILSGCAGTAGAPTETTTPPVAAEPSPSATPEPSASVEPTEPAEPEPLIISTAGLDAVKLDSPVPDGLAIAEYVEDYCPDGSGAWAPAGDTSKDDEDYVIRTKDLDPKKKVDVIIVFSPDIETPSGVRVGQSLKEVKKILPEMKKIKSDGEADLIELYEVKDDLGQLVFEFAEGKKLVDIKALSNDIEPFTIWYSDGGGRCGA